MTLSVPGLIEVARVTVRVAKTSLGITDRRRWSGLAPSRHSDTRERAARLANLIPPGSSVLDLGSGPQWLREFLPDGTVYQPCDVADGPDVIHCDFNIGHYPDLNRRYDVVVCAGLLEYLREPETFLRRLPELGDTVLLTYIGVGDVMDRATGERGGRLGRTRYGFMNHLAYGELESMLDRLGYGWERVQPWDAVGAGFRISLTRPSQEVPGSSASSSHPGAVPAAGKPEA